MKKKLFISFLILLYAMFHFYFWTSTHGYRTFNFKIVKPESRYALLTEAFYNKQLHLLEQPNPELLKLSDPYNPKTNFKYRLHDASLYKGKYYLYFGPGPVLLLFLPYKLVTGYYMPDDFAVFIFSLGIFIFSLLILLHLKNKYFYDLPHRFFLITGLLLGYSNFTSWILKRADIYEIAISCGMFCLLGAIYFTCIALENKKNSLFLLLLASIFLCFGTLTRPPIGLSGCILLFALFKLRNKNIKSFFLNSLLVLLPLGIGFLLTALYNYLRFENIFDFGGDYQLTASDVRTYKLYGLEYILPGLYCFFLSKFSFSTHFPFVHPIPQGIPEIFLTTNVYFTEEMVGLFSGNPFIFLLLLLPIIFLFIKIISGEEAFFKGLFPKDETIIILIPAVLNIGILLIRPYANFRYLVDFSVLITLFTIILWLYSNKILRSQKAKFVINVLAVFLLFISIYCGFAISVAPYFDKGLQTINPDEYEKIKLCFSWVENFLNSR